jgi:hypothetical protein
MLLESINFQLDLGSLSLHHHTVIYQSKHKVTKQIFFSVSRRDSDIAYSLLDKFQVFQDVNQNATGNRAGKKEEVTDNL